MQEIQATHDIGAYWRNEMASQGIRVVGPNDTLSSASQSTGASHSQLAQHNPSVYGSMTPGAGVPIHPPQPEWTSHTISFGFQNSVSQMAADMGARPQDIKEQLQSQGAWDEQANAPIPGSNVSLWGYDPSELKAQRGYEQAAARQNQAAAFAAMASAPAQSAGTPVSTGSGSGSSVTTPTPSAYDHSLWDDINAGLVDNWQEADAPSTDRPSIAEMEASLDKDAE